MLSGQISSLRHYAVRSYEQLCQHGSSTADGYTENRYQQGEIHTLHLQLRELLVNQQSCVLSYQFRSSLLWAKKSTALQICNAPFTYCFKANKWFKKINAKALIQKYLLLLLHVQVSAKVCCLILQHQGLFRFFCCTLREKDSRQTNPSSLHRKQKD